MGWKLGSRNMLSGHRDHPMQLGSPVSWACVGSLDLLKPLSTSWLLPVVCAGHVLLGESTPFFVETHEGCLNLIS